MTFYCLTKIIDLYDYCKKQHYPIQGVKAINLFGVLFVRKDAVLSDVDINHEKIHTEQMKELLFVFFYLWYVIEWFIRLFKEGNAYMNISFENEAYFNQDNLNYINERKRFSFLDYM